MVYSQMFPPMPRNDMVEGTDVHSALRARPLNSLVRLVWRPLWAEQVGSIPQEELREIIEGYRCDLEKVMNLKDFTLLASYRKAEGLWKVCLHENTLHLCAWEMDEWRCEVGDGREVCIPARRNRLS